ncbi:LPD7 domain-containing protein [Neisseria elongata]
MANDYAPPTYDEVQAALSYIPTPATHNEWYPIAIAIKDALGENGFTLWDEWSRQGKGYNSSVVKSTWKSATPKPGGITAATLFRLARDNGYRPERPYVPPTPEQMAAREAEQRARDEAVARELADTRRQAAKKAYGIWKNADKTVDLNHAYLQRKGIAEAELVRGIRQNEYQGQRQLVIPLYQGGELVSVQTINEAGGKHFLKGGEKSGSYAVLGNLEREAHKGIVLAEGFATAASIRKATGAPVVIAFDSGNMIRIAENMASRLSAEQRVVFAADNDPSGTGLAAASQAAVILGSRARIALPDFSPETVGRFQAAHGAWDEKRNRENLPTDFNDLHLTEGIEAVRAQMAAALQMPERQPEIAPASETPQPAAARNAAFSMSAANEKQAEQEQSMAQPPETSSQTPPHPEGSGIYAYASREQNGRHYAVFTGAFGKLFNYPVVPAEGAQTEQEAREAADQTITMHRNDDFIGTAWQSNKGQAEVYGWTNLPTFMPAKTGKEPQYGVRYENDERHQTVGYRSDIETMMQRDAVQLAEKQVQADERQPVSDWLAQSGLSAIQAGRARSILDKRINYRGYGETSRADFILERTAEGWTTRRGTDGNGKPTLGIWSPDGEVGYDITETEKQFADWLAQRQTENIRPSHEPNTVRQPERPSERPAVRLKEGHIRLENPVAFERTPFGYRTAEMAHNAAFERRHITIAGGRIVGAHPGLAQEMGWATVGAIRPKSEQTLQQEAQAAAEQAARAAETAKTAQAAVAAMRLNETAAQIAPELRQQAQQDINAALNDPTLDGRERIIAAQETAAAYRDNGRPSENPAAAAPPVDPEWEQAVADERRMNEERRAERAPWRDFPRLIRNGSLAELKDAAGYTQAKAGDAEAAYDMVKSLLSTETLDNIRELAGGRVPILISVKAQESSGKNKIPEAMAHAIRASTGWPVDAEIVQINKPGRTGSGSSHRLAFQPVFDGKVEAGRDYLILDDNSTMGGTIASLRGYIENRGGRVIGAAVMSARETALDIVPTRNQLNEIQRKHGDAPNDYWTREFGYGIDRLTRAEAGVIRSAGVFDSIRDRIAAARLQTGVGVDGTTVPRTPVDTAQPQRDRSGTNRPQQEQPDSIAPAPTQAAAPDAAAFSMPAENAGQTEQEQNMAQQANTPKAARQPENHSPAPAEPASEAAFAVYPGRNYGDAPRAEVDADNRAIHFYESDFKKYEFDDISTNIGYRGLTPEAIQQQMDKDPVLRGYYGITHNDGTVFFPRNEKGWSSPQKGKRPEKNSEPLPQQTPASTLAAKQEESVLTSSQQENGIEYGGSRTQHTPEPETITAVEVQESLRRIRSAERMQDGFRQPETPQQPEILLTKRPEPEIPAAVQKDAEPAPETPAKPKPVLDLNYETAAGLDARYVRYDGRYLDPNNARTVLFEDKGAKIKTAREDAQTISDMLDTAQAKNWDNIRISGSREFKRQMWLEAELRGIPNSGYSPSKEDLAMRDQMRAARERNSIEAGGINRTAEASAHNPPPRQPENRQSAHSPSEQLVTDDSVRLKSEAANLQTRAETPAQTQAANRAAETAVQAADEQQSGPKPDSGRTADKSQDPSSPNHALEAARAAYLSKADKLSKAAKEQLANHERDFAEAVKGIPEGNRESAMLHFYTSMQKRMSGTKLDMPEPTATAERSQTQQPRQPSVQPKRRDDGMDMDR